jgi:hypothetical protein
MLVITVEGLLRHCVATVTHVLLQVRGATAQLVYGKLDGQKRRKLRSRVMGLGKYHDWLG